MDPKQLNQLDPKLRDAYQRVMGTPIPPAPTQSQPDPQPPSQPDPIPQPLSESAPTQPSQEPTAPEPPAPLETSPQSEIFPVPQESPLASLNESIVQPELQPVSASDSTIQPAPELSTRPEPLEAQPSQSFDQMNTQVATNADFFQSSQTPQSQPQASAQTTVVKKGFKMSGVLIVVIILIFISLYTIFWTKLFNVKLPF